MTSCSLVVVVASIRSLRSVSRSSFASSSVVRYTSGPVDYIHSIRTGLNCILKLFLLLDYTIVVMVNKCCAVGCKSGYTGHSPTPSDARITFHSFPMDSVLREKWIRANPRKDFVSSKHSHMCSLHFRGSDFVEEHCDSNTTRRKTCLTAS